MVQLGGGGVFPHFFSKICDNMVWGDETFLKNWSKRGYPYFGQFLAILGISGENGVKPAEKPVHHPSWVISEVLPRVYFALPACLGPKYTLGRASEMARGGWCTVFSAGLHPLLWETSLAHRFQQKSPKLPKTAQNRGTPLFDQFFRKVAPL